MKAIHDEIDAKLKELSDMDRAADLTGFFIGALCGASAAFLIAIFLAAYL